MRFYRTGKYARYPTNRRHVNTVFQSYALFPHMTAFENVAFGLRCQKLAQKEIKTRVFKLLEKIHLQSFAKRKPEQLSVPTATSCYCTRSSEPPSCFTTR